MTPGNQIDVIWVMIIYLDNITIYLSDADNQITLSGIPFDGKVIMHGSISELDKSINIIEGGGIGELGALSFGIARYTTNSATNDFFNEFYPATSRYVSGRIVDFGIVWKGATLLNQITWLNRYYIEDYFYNEDVIQLSCIEYNELNELYEQELPYYKIQDELDNSLSYFPKAPDDNINEPIPIVYGDFSLYEEEIYLSYGLYCRIPGIVNEKYIVGAIFTSHPCKSPGGVLPYLASFADSIDSYVKISPIGTVLINNQAGLKTYFQSYDNEITGTVWLRMNTVSPALYPSGTKIQDISAVLNTDRDDYLILNPGEMVYATFLNQASTNEIGKAKGTNIPSELRLTVHTDIPSMSLNIGVFNKSKFDAGVTPNTIFGPTGIITGGTQDTNFVYLFFGNNGILTDSGDVNAAYTVEELTSLHYYAKNNTLSPLKIYNMYVSMTDFKVLGLSTLKKIEYSKRDLMFVQPRPVYYNLKETKVKELFL